MIYKVADELRVGEGRAGVTPVPSQVTGSSSEDRF